MTSDQATRARSRRRGIALVAHDRRKQDLTEWARFNRGVLARHCLYATGATGRLLNEELGLPVTCFRSGPLGGDQQIGAGIVDGEIDLLVFLWDPLASQPHDHDVKALLRIAVVWNIPVACNRASADFLISSPLVNEPGPDEASAAAVPGMTEPGPDEGGAAAVPGMTEPGPDEGGAAAVPGMHEPGPGEDAP